MTPTIQFGIATTCLYLALAVVFSALSSLQETRVEPPKILGFFLFILSLALWLLNIYLAVNTF